MGSRCPELGRSPESVGSFEYNSYLEFETELDLPQPLRRKPREVKPRLGHEKPLCSFVTLLAKRSLQADQRCDRWCVYFPIECIVLHLTKKERRFYLEKGKHSNPPQVEIELLSQDQNPGCRVFTTKHPTYCLDKFLA